LERPHWTNRAGATTGTTEQELPLDQPSRSGLTGTTEQERPHWNNRADPTTGPTEQERPLERPSRRVRAIFINFIELIDELIDEL